MTDLVSNPVRVPRQADSGAFLGIYVVGFAVVLSVALVAQAFALPWRSWFPGAEGQKSFVGSVRASVYTFMSYLN